MIRMQRFHAALDAFSVCLSLSEASIIPFSVDWIEVYVSIQVHVHQAFSVTSGSTQFRKIWVQAIDERTVAVVEPV